MIMELFNIRNDFITNWAKIIAAFFMVLVSLRIYRYFGSTYRQLQHLPCVGSAVYTLYMISTYICKKRKHVHPFTYHFQVLCGICWLYSKQRIFYAWTALFPIVMFYKPETVEALLNNNATVDKADSYALVRSLVGDGLITSSPGKWRMRRKLLNPSFHIRILEDFMPIYNEQAQILVGKLRTVTNKKWVNIAPLITACTLDIICETMMGVRLNEQEVPNSEYARAVYESAEILTHRMFRPWLWNDTIFSLFPSGIKFNRSAKIIQDLTRKVIKEKKKILLKEMEDNVQSSIKRDDENRSDVDQTSVPKKKKVFLELLLEHHLNDGSLTEEDIADEVNTFMIAGHDTTALSVFWTLYNLGLQPDIQERLFMELDAIFGSDLDRPVTSDDLKSMKYLECVIKESMRLFPPAPLFVRKLTHDLQVSDYTVPSGSMCVVLAYMLHRDPESFPNPEYFDPDRFLPENTAGRHPFAYVPFSAGPRNCIGQKFAIMEEKTILAHILRNFEVKSLDQRDRVQLLPVVLLKSVDAIRIQVISRHQ